MKIEMPKWAKKLRKPSRYKVLYGGRGGAKSWTIARQLLLDGLERPLRILCAREYQNSIKDSSHRLLKDQVHALGLQKHYEVQTNRIIGKNGTEFGFAGLRHNVADLKSWEGADRCWVEEAHSVSKESWKVLIPTIRKEGSEIWISFNPELDTDYTYQYFVVNPPDDAVVLYVNWRDNPWFPQVLDKERRRLKVLDPDEYEVVWEGKTRAAVSGAIYARQLEQATRAGRITSVPYTPNVPVERIWDFGWSDCVSIIMAQRVGLEHRIIDYMQDSQRQVIEYIKDMQELPYVFSRDHIPWDGFMKTLAADGKTIASKIEALAKTEVVPVPQTSVADGIDAARAAFSYTWFDKERAHDLLESLRHYRYKVGDDGRVSRQPLHDQYSHGADAFRYYALSFKGDHNTEVTPHAEPQQPVADQYIISTGWML